MTPPFKIGQLVKRKFNHYEWLSTPDPFVVKKCFKNENHYSVFLEGIEGCYHSNSFELYIENIYILDEELFTI